MARSRAEYLALIEKLEEMAERNFGMYRLRVIALTLLGYAFIWFVLALLCVAVVCLLFVLVKLPYLAIKIGLPLLLLIGVILRAFWVKFDPVEGIYLTRKEVPRIFETVEEIRRKIGAPRLDAIVLDGEFNAAIVQIPRLGLLGWHKNHLLIGMQYMQALSPGEFRATLAHEMGHLSGSHGKLSAWVYGSRQVWMQLLSRLAEDQSFATLLFRRFFARFVPYFDAYTFVLARRQEYEADVCAVEVAGKQAAADRLINGSIKGQYTSRHYWPEVLERASDLPAPPVSVYSDLASLINKKVEPEEAEMWLSQALLKKTDYDDTHPCLSDRLSAMLGLPAERLKEYAQARLAEILGEDRSAADDLFGASLTKYLRLLDEQWMRTATPAWEDRHQTWQALKEHLAELEEKASTAQLSDDEIAFLAYRTAQVKGFSQALPLFHEALEKQPDNAELNQVYGDWLADGKDERCLEHLKRAMELDRMRGLECCQTIYAFLKGAGKDEEAEYYVDLAGQFYEELMESRRERSTFTNLDVFEDHGLPAPELAQLQDQLQRYKRVKKAFLVRKKLKYFADRPLFVLVIDPSWVLFQDEQADQKLVEQISHEVQFPGETLIITRSLAPVQLKARLDRWPGAQLN